MLRKNFVIFLSLCVAYSVFMHGARGSHQVSAQQLFNELTCLNPEQAAKDMTEVLQAKQAWLQEQINQESSLDEMQEDLTAIINFVTIVEMAHELRAPNEEFNRYAPLVVEQLEKFHERLPGEPGFDEGGNLIGFRMAQTVA